MDIAILHCTAWGYGPRAASLAAHIEDALDVRVKRQPGKPGQFDVVVDGKVIASRGGSMMKKLLGGGWPDPDEVVEKIESLQQQQGAKPKR